MQKCSMNRSFCVWPGNCSPTRSATPANTIRSRNKKTTIPTEAKKRMRSLRARQLSPKSFLKIIYNCSSKQHSSFVIAFIIFSLYSFFGNIINVLRHTCNYEEIASQNGYAQILRGNNSFKRYCVATCFRKTWRSVNCNGVGFALDSTRNQSS